MELTSNTIFITGGGSGIGRALAEAFHRLGNTVIIGGRRALALSEVCQANPGMKSMVFDVRDPRQVSAIEEQLITRFPALNCVVNNAGVQRAHDFGGDIVSIEAIQDEIATNFTGLVTLCAAFLPHLRKQQRSTLINVSSGLGLIPLSLVPVYSATKAAVHSFTRSLRHQLRNSAVEVIELIPPSVATELRAGRVETPRKGPLPMPLDQFITESMRGFEAGESEIAVGTARLALSATANDEVKHIFTAMNPQT